MHFKPLFLLFLFFLFTQIGFSQKYTWNWCVGLNSPLNATAKFMEVDRAGNSYLLARFEGDYRKQNRTVPNAIDMVDVHWVLTKYAPSGEEVWQKDLNAYTPMDLKGLKVDYAGNCLIIGVFSKPYIYFLGERMENLNPVDNFNDGFIAKIATTGELEWLASTARRLQETISHLSVDGMGNAYLLTEGQKIDKNEKAANPNKLTFAKRQVRALALIKYSPSGKRLWHYNIDERLPKRISVFKLKTDFEGNVYITGRHAGGLQNDLTFFGLETGLVKMRQVLPYNTANFLLKINADGEFEWVDQFPNIDIEVDELGNIFFFNLLGPDYWDIGQVTIETFIGKELVLVKYNSDGEYEQHATFGDKGFLEYWARLKLSGSQSRIFGTKDEFDVGFWEYEDFKVGLDGNVYVLSKLEPQSTLGNNQTSLAGIFLIKFSLECEIISYAERINDDFKIDTQNPFIYEAQLDFLAVDLEGNAFISGQQKSQNLNIGGRQITNPFQAQGVPSIYLGKLQLFD